MVVIYKGQSHKNMLLKGQCSRNSIKRDRVASRVATEISRLQNFAKYLFRILQTTTANFAKFQEMKVARFCTISQKIVQKNIVDNSMAYNL